MVVVCYWVAAGEDLDYVLREPGYLPLDFEGDSEDEGVFVLRAYTGEVFRYEAIVDVMA